MSLSEKIPLMKIFITILFFIFSLQPWTNADEVSDFEIAGLSIGDSALNVLTKSKIERAKDNDPQNGYLYKINDFYALTFYDIKGLDNYDSIQIHFKNNDKKYIIYGFAGIKEFRNNIHECPKLMKKIGLTLDEILSSARKEVYERYEHRSKKGFLETYWYIYNDKANIVLSCEDWNEDTNIVDMLALSVNSSELQKFFNNKAY